MKKSNEHSEPYYCSKVGIMTIHNKGYISYRPHNNKKKSEHQENIMQDELNFLLKSLKGKKLPFFADNRHLQVIDSQVTEFMKTQSVLFTSKCAILVALVISKFLFHIALFFNKPSYPIKAFTDKNKVRKCLMNNEIR